MKRRPRQLELDLRTWGGRRRGAGRKPSSTRRMVCRRKRPHLSRHHPVVVTMRVHDDVGSLRQRSPFRAIHSALVAGCQRDGFRVTQFSVQKRHIHLTVEANSQVHLSRGMQGLSIRMARALNRELGRRGKVFSDRYHSRVLKTPRQVRNAVAYVANNYRHHTARTGQALGYVDPYSSWAYFDGWRQRLTRQQRDNRKEKAPVAPPRTWLLRVGWRRHGLVSVNEIPGRLPRA